MMPTALGERSWSPNMLSIRSQHDQYRSLPGTPLGLGPRNLSSMDLGPSLDHARSLIQPGSDYFSSPAGRYNTGMRPRSPFPGVSEFGPEGGFSTAPYSTPEISADNLTELINRSNMAASLINFQVGHSAKHAKIFPHMCDDGRYPPEFSTPKTVEVMRVLDNSQLDRIMQAYRLPLDLSPLDRLARGNPNHSSSRTRQLKLYAIWEFVGALKLAEYEKMRRGMI